ncbi:MAG: hypothetical protein LUC93_01080 [Planctomycetaceae bacterium]|nr:hypothetical protein [Planctomycetaceae bacterium]
MIRGFVLGVVLLAAVGWCMVQESIKQTQARYELAELARREDDVKKRLDKLRAKEQELRSPTRLASLVREHRLNLVALGTTEPLPAPFRTGRKPGQIMDEVETDGNLAGTEIPWDVASAGGR